MAAFALSYYHVTRSDIRHIYSYRVRQPFIPSPRCHGDTSQFLPTPLNQLYPPRFYDYYPAFQVGLPRAPAFNRLSASQIQQLLQRICKPIACQRVTTRSKVNPRPRRKEVKVVRFTIPEDEADEIDHGNGLDNCHHLQTKPATTQAKVTRDDEPIQLPELRNKNRRKELRRNMVRPTLPSEISSKVILPPINTSKTPGDLSARTR